MRSRRSRTRLRIAMGGALLLALNVLVFAVLTWPRLNRVRRAESQAQVAAVKRAALESLWSQVSARKALVEQNRRDIDSLHFDHLKWRSQDLFAAQREIEKLAVSSGLRPKRSTYAIERIRGTDLSRCVVTLPLDGTYASLTDFLTQVGNAKRFIVVDQMALSQDDQSAKMSLRLSAIFKEGDTSASQ